jgi:hypothetical protein
MRLTLFRILWLGLGALLALFLLEIVLRLLPVSMGLYRTTKFEHWPLQSSEPRLAYAHSYGWNMSNAHRGTTNNYGHIAPFDYQQNSHPILVIGDSFVESLMNDYPDTLQGQLGQRIGAPESVYGLGVSGLSASEYVALSRMARDEFKPAAAVFLITDGDFSESLGPRPGHHYLVPAGDVLKLHYAPLKDKSLMKKVREAIGDIAIYRYFQVNLQFSPENMVKGFQPKAAEQIPIARTPVNTINQAMVADWFLSELPLALGLPPGCIVLLMDSDRYAIYKTQLASPRKDAPQVRQRFIAQAQELGFGVIDLDPVFRQLYAQNHIKFDYWPLDRHWNRVGHGVGTDLAYQHLFTKEHSSCSKITDQTHGMSHFQTIRP